MKYDEVYRFGSTENQKEMVNALEKLVTCIEMENWQKAENFAATVKGLRSAWSKGKLPCTSCILRPDMPENHIGSFKFIHCIEVNAGSIILYQSINLNRSKFQSGLFNILWIILIFGEDMSQ